jgi:hypothetical protein
LEVWSQPTAASAASNAMVKPLRLIMDVPQTLRLCRATMRSRATPGKTGGEPA